MISIATITMLMAGASASTCQFIEGNYYCDETSLVQFKDVGFSSSYNRVTSFNNDGTCSYEPYHFSGSLAPFDEELSVHFRGPIKLENFKVFSGSGSSGNKKRALHHRHADPEPVVVTAYDYYTQFVTVGADGNTHTEEAPAAAPATSAAPAPTSSAAPAPSSSSSSETPSTTEAAPTTSETPSSTSSSSSTSVPVNNYNFNHQDEHTTTGPSVITTTSSSATSSSSSSSSAPTSNSDWSLISNYNAKSNSADNLVFLNNLGGSGSGTFDFQFGNSLSYAGSDGVSAASSPQVLSETTVGSNHEFIIFSGDKCQGDSCGYYRPGTVAYHGFGGAQKVFVFEFSMPRDYSASGFNADMPAVWLLNAQIPRTLQYGAKSCSCWSSGCGELDLWEILNSGNDRLTTTLHDKQNGGGGTSNYFERPTSGTSKGAAIFQGTTITVVEIDEIPESIDDSTIQNWISNGGSPSYVTL